MSGYDFDTVAELCEICKELLRIVEAQESLLAQFGAIEEAEATADAKRRLAALQGPLSPR